MVSIHAPLRGATTTLGTIMSGVWFQSTRPCEARRQTIYPLLQGVIGFNPRALARRDQIDLCQYHRCICFNPRALARRDSARKLQMPQAAQFQSTRPCEARLFSCFLDSTKSTGFNPRALARRDQNTKRLNNTNYPCFNPRALARRDRCHGKRHASHSEFQSTRPCEARLTWF